MPNLNTPNSATRYRGWFLDQLNGVIEAYYNSTAFLRSSATALTLLIATTFNAAVTFASSALSNSATGGIGYATGAGGAVTQATSKSTGVTLNTICGAITMNAASLAAGGEVGFTVTNSAVAARDVVVVSIASAATADSYGVTVDAVGAGSFRISISNLTAGALAEAIVLNFAVIKAVNA